MTRLPQVLRQRARAARRDPTSPSALADDIAAAEAELGDHGRVLRAPQRHRAARAGDGRGADATSQAAAVADRLAAAVRARRPA